MQPVCYLISQLCFIHVFDSELCACSNEQDLTAFLGRV